MAKRQMQLRYRMAPRARVQAAVSAAARRIAAEAREEAHRLYAVGGACALGWLENSQPDLWSRLTVGGVEPWWVLGLGLELAGRGLKSRKLREVATGALCVAAADLGRSIAGG